MRKKSILNVNGGFTCLPVRDGGQQQLSTTRARRLVIYNLIAGQHLINYLCRLSIPFVV
eukprot:COSAG06_NODE_50868_length_315_cov_2.388889_1_plen_58_part_01